MMVYEVHAEGLGRRLWAADTAHEAMNLAYAQWYEENDENDHEDANAEWEGHILKSVEKLGTLENELPGPGAVTIVAKDDGVWIVAQAANGKHGLLNLNAIANNMEPGIIRDAFIGAIGEFMVAK